MGTKDEFINQIHQAFTFKEEYITLGSAIFEKECIPNLHVKVPLKTLNRHGLLAGATGTGKTKTLQVIAEALSAKSIPVVMMDIKGDLSGIAKAGTTNTKIEDRHQKIGIAYSPYEFPVELLSLSDEKGIRLRATVSEFGPVLFSKMLELNETQSSIVSVLFKYCDDNNLPLLDLKDFKKILQFAINEGKPKLEENYGMISPASIGIILRKVVELEQQGAELFFGEKSFEVNDLVRIDDNGYGIISIIRLVDLQDRPKLFSTFMLSLLAEIYSSFPEEGDLSQPKLIIFIDEAHLIFNDAPKALLEQIETIIKLIRSKGVGIYFCTQNPTDIPASVLSQLGLKVQHALRAFTAQDRKMIKLTAENYPLSDYYKTDELLTSLGIGEAAISALDEKGSPTPLAATLLCAPRSRMDILTPQEIDDVLSKSKLVQKYNQVIDRESAFEILNKKLENAKKIQETTFQIPKQETKTQTTKRQKEDKSVLQDVLNSKVTKQIGTTVMRELTRGILGVLGLGGTSKRR